MVLCGFSWIESEGHVNSLTRWDDLGLKIVMKVRGRRVKTVNAEIMICGSKYDFAIR